MRSATESIARLLSWISSKSQPVSSLVPMVALSALKTGVLETGQAQAETVAAISSKSVSG